MEDFAWWFLAAKVLFLIINYLSLYKLEYCISQEYGSHGQLLKVTIYTVEYRSTTRQVHQTSDTV